MKKLVLLFLSLILLLCACSAQTDSSSETQNSDSSTVETSNTSTPVQDDNSSSDETSDEASNESFDETSSDIPDNTSKIQLDLEPNPKDTRNVYIQATVDGDLPMYARYGDNIYVSQYVDEVFGTSRICNGVETAFFPNASNMYEKDGIIYGVLSEGESYIELTRYYCRFNEDGTYEKLFECWNVFYSGEKIYFYEYIPAENESEEGTRNICSANIDGSGKQIIFEDIKTYSDNIICYKEYLICECFDGIYVINIDGTTKQVINIGDKNYFISFVNNDYIYIISNMS